jgi:TolB-like protein/DNA-binding winged helix-turn-helix (wHTH) protein/Flp pilus assembly protein TadD
MANLPLPSARWRFGVFEVDAGSGELRKDGGKIRLPEQPFQILVALLEHPGEVVTRQDLQDRLWKGETFVDFDANLNTAISLLRTALGDSAKTPRFIETLPRRGYRFLAEVRAVDGAPDPGRPVPVARARPVVALAVLAVLALAGLASYHLSRGAPPADSVAVLPLVYVAAEGERDQEYLADGLTSALITELARLGVPNVISETSVMQYKAARKPLPEIARELGAQIIVEGSVLREGNTVRVNAQLIDARHDRHLWARSYQREMDSLLALQDEIASAIVQEIRTTLAAAAPAARAVPRRLDPQAHEAYLRGRHALRSEVEERRVKSLAFFEEAMRLEPTFAPVYQALAEYYASTYVVPPAEAWAHVRRYARKALELDGTLASAHLSLADASLWGDWDWATAEREFQRSLELDPGDATTRRSYALFLDLVGRPRAALAQLQRVRELDPVATSTYYALGFHFYLSRQYGDALQHLATVRELSPHDPMGFESSWGVSLETGDYPQAIAMAEQAITLWGRDPAFVTALAVARGRAGDEEGARALLAELHAAAGKGHFRPSWFAMIHMSLGEADQAMVWLERAFEQRDPKTLQLRVSPLFDPLRADARFENLVRRIQFPPPLEDPHPRASGSTGPAGAEIEGPGAWGQGLPGAAPSRI